METELFSLSTNRPREFHSIISTLPLAPFLFCTLTVAIVQTDIESFKFSLMLYAF